jgi:hypothetical protein
MKQLFYLLVPLGAAMLIFSIRGVIGVVKAKLLYEQPYIEDSGSFTVTEAGNYGIWLNGKQFGKSPYGEFGLQLSIKETGEMIPLSRSLMRTTVKGFGTARMELYTFHADAGNYTLRRTDEANLGDRMLSGIGKVLSRYPVDYAQFSFRIYPHRTAALGVVYSFGITLSFMLMIWGILLPHYLYAKGKPRRMRA